MGGECGEHGALVVGGKVKETVPGQQSVELPVEFQTPHICLDRFGAPYVFGIKPGHDVSGINAGQLCAAFCQIAANGFA